MWRWRRQSGEIELGRTCAGELGRERLPVNDAAAVAVAVAVSMESLSMDPVVFGVTAVGSVVAQNYLPLLV